MDSSLIATLITGAYATVGIYLNKKSASSELGAAVKMLKDMVFQDQQDIKNLQDSKKTNDLIHFFKTSFVNAIISRNSDIINNDSTIKENNILVSSMTYYANEIADFGLKYYDSDYRHNEKIAHETFTEHLQNQIDSIMSIFLHMLSEGVKGERCYMHGNQIIGIGFIEYMATIDKANKEPDCFAYNQILVTDLVANGLSESDLITKFVTFIGNFMNNFKKKYILFTKLDDYDKHIEEKMNKQKI